MECIICAESFSPSRLEAISPCNHSGVCSICYVRIRTLLGDLNCPICKQEAESVICTRETNRTFQSFTIWGNDAGPDFIYDLKSKMFFPKDYHRIEIGNLWSCKCKICGTFKRDLKSLKQHATKDHNAIMCNLCIEHKKVFPAEQQIYTPSEYEQHLRKGDKDGSEGHPNCEFCKVRYYDKTLLFTHLIKDHFSCHICDKAGIKYRYYKDYLDLESHFRKEHFLCEDQMCLAKKYIVFANDIDYAAHSRSWHPQLQISRTIPIYFKSSRDSKRSGKDSEENEQFDDEVDSMKNRVSSTSRFEGGMGGRAKNGEWQVELPDPARDPREIARGLNPPQLELFPTSINFDPRIEDFPTLGNPPISGMRLQSNPMQVSDDNLETNLKWVEPKTDKDSYPALANPLNTLNHIGNLKVKKSKVKKSKPASIEPQPTYKEMIDPQPSNAVRIIMENYTPKSSRNEQLTLAEKIKIQNERDSKKLSVHKSTSSSNFVQSEVTSQTQIISQTADGSNLKHSVSLNDLSMENLRKTESNNTKKPSKSMTPNSSWQMAFKESGLTEKFKNTKGLTVVKPKAKNEFVEDEALIPSKQLQMSLKTGDENLSNSFQFSPPKRGFGRGSKPDLDSKIEPPPPPGFTSTAGVSQNSTKWTTQEEKESNSVQVTSKTFVDSDFPTLFTINEPQKFEANSNLVQMPPKWTTIGGTSEEREKEKVALPSPFEDSDFPTLSTVSGSQKPIAWGPTQKKVDQVQTTKRKKVDLSKLAYK